MVDKVVVKYIGKRPTKGSPGSVCFDARAARGALIGRGEVQVVPLGLRVELPEGYEIQVRPRSGLAKRGVIVTLGTVDSDYRGEIGAIVHNSSGELLTIKTGDRIAQLAVREVPLVEWVEVDELSKTDRGSHGFGSTGVK
jgi:dUTP pyrophosphatase